MCPKNLTAVGTFGHLILHSPRVFRGFCEQVVQFFHDQMGSPVTMDPRQCLLGLCPDPYMDKHS